MKKIIFTVTNDLNFDQRMQRICFTLANSGFDVLLVGRKKRDSSALIVRNFFQHRLNCYFEKGKLFYLEYNLRLYFFLLKQQFDVICGIDLDTILPCIAVAKSKKKPVVYDAHELFPEVPEVTNRALIKGIWTGVERFTFKKVDLVYTVSQGIADLFYKRYNKPVSLIRNLPFKRKLKAEHLESKGKYILYQGALNMGRGLENLILAMEDIELPLYLAGEGDLSDSLRSLVKKKKLEEKVIFLGFVLPKDLKAYTDQAFIGINILENIGLSYYYSLSNKFFDYMQAAVPSINMNFPEYRHLNGLYDVGILIDDIQVNTVQSALKELILNKEKYNRLSENALTAANLLNWENEAESLIDIYQNIGR